MTSQINDKRSLTNKLNEIKLNYDWVEKLDVISDVKEITSHFKESSANHDFNRETIFLKQAEAAVLEVVPKLRSLNIKIEVPKDYFTDKVKSDTHMVKVMAKNEEEKKARERIEKIKRLRQERKLAKMRQVETKLAKLKEKKDFNQKVKNYKKGKEKNLDFLNNNQVKNKNKKISKKSTEKKKKYGYGGQKKRSKYNTKESASDVSGFRSKLYSGSNKKAKSKRPSKNKRMKMKAKV